MDKVVASTHKMPPVAHFVTAEPMATVAQLQSEHHELEAQLDALNRHLYLSPEEQVERKRIQKLKLQKKDAIARLLDSQQQPQHHA